MSSIDMTQKLIDEKTAKLENMSSNEVKNAFELQTAEEAK